MCAYREDSGSQDSVLHFGIVIGFRDLLVELSDLVVVRRTVETLLG